MIPLELASEECYGEVQVFVMSGSKWLKKKCRKFPFVGLIITCEEIKLRDWETMFVWTKVFSNMDKILKAVTRSLFQEFSSGRELPPKIPV